MVIIAANSKIILVFLLMLMLSLVSKFSIYIPVKYLLFVTNYDM